MTNPPVGPRFHLAPGTVLRGGRRLPLPHAAPSGPSTASGRSAPAAPSDPTTSQAPSTPSEPGTEPAPDGFRNTLRDRAALAVAIDPVWLLAPLYARDAAGLTPPTDGPAPTAGPIDPPVDRRIVTADDADGDWPAWWAAALAYRPGTPAPRQTDLIAGSPALQRLWSELEPDFGDWLAGRKPREPGRDAPARAVERAALKGFTARNGREPGRWTVRILEIPVTGRYLHSPERRRIVVSAALRADPTRYAAALAAELPGHF